LREHTEVVVFGAERTEEVSIKKGEANCRGKVHVTTRYERKKKNDLG